MSTGQFIFFIGSGLLVFTIILGVVFWLKKPQYTPENVASADTEGKNTQKLRSGYPTNRLTIHREPVRPAAFGTVVLHEGTEHLTEEQTELLSGTAVVPNTETPSGPLTEKLQAGTVLLSEETTLLQQTEDTVPLQDAPYSPVCETEILSSEDQLGITENINGTTPSSSV